MMLKGEIMVINIIGWVIWAFVTFLAITFPIGIYTKYKHGKSVQGATILQTIVLMIIAVVFFFSSWNKLHIIWVVLLSLFIMSLLAYNSGRRKGAREYDN